jgi:hypothetical protein
MALDMSDDHSPLPLPPPPPTDAPQPDDNDVLAAFDCVDCGQPHPGGCTAHEPDRDDDGRCTGTYQPCRWAAQQNSDRCFRHRVEANNLSYRLRSRLEQLVPTALDELERVLHSKNASDSDTIRAAITVLDRANETARVSRQEISGPEGGPVEIDDTRGRDLHSLIAADPDVARRLDRVSRDLRVVPDLPPGDAEEDAS